jgi:hypothetical protein
VVSGLFGERVASNRGRVTPPNQTLPSLIALKTSEPRQRKRMCGVSGQAGIAQAIPSKFRTVGTHATTKPIPSKVIMKNALIALAFVFGAAAAHAQTGTAMKETDKATAESAKAATESSKAAMSGEPAKTVHKAKAKMHRAKARHARHEANDAAKEATK